MKLIGSKTSPFVRKVRILLAEKRLPCEFLEESPWTAQTTVPRYNPLNKVPVLQLDDGESLYDSSVITEYLDTLPGPRFIPATGSERARVRRDEALGDGIGEAGITMFLERKRSAELQDASWIARQRDKMDAGIAALAKSVGPESSIGAAQINIGDISCACALFWVEFRLPEIDWRAHANLKEWAERLEALPSFAATRPQA
jgi:glutathione S-transferase